MVLYVDHLAVDLSASVDERGGLCLRSHAQRYRRVGFGPLFGYRGRFTIRFVDTGTAPVPATVRPLRENASV